MTDLVGMATVFAIFSTLAMVSAAHRAADRDPVRAGLSHSPQQRRADAVG